MIRVDIIELIDNKGAYDHLLSIRNGKGYKTIEMPTGLKLIFEIHFNEPKDELLFKLKYPEYITND